MAKTEKQRDSVVFYRSFYESIKELEPSQQAEVYSAIFEFSLNGVEPQISGIAKAIFTLIKPQIIANNARYFNGQRGGRPTKNESGNEQNESENDAEDDAENSEPKAKQTETEAKPKQNLGETEIEPSKNLDITETEPSIIQTETEAKPNENENVNDNENDNVNGKVNVKEKGSVRGKTPSATSRGTPTRFCKPTVEEIRAYCEERGNNVDPQRFFDFYESKGWMVGRTPMKDWKACVRTWEQRDKQPLGTKQSSSDDDWLKTLAEL